MIQSRKTETRATPVSRRAQVDLLIRIVLYLVRRGEPWILGCSQFELWDLDLWAAVPDARGATPLEHWRCVRRIGVPYEPRRYSLPAGVAPVLLGSEQVSKLTGGQVDEWASGLAKLRVQNIVGAVA